VSRNPIDYLRDIRDSCQRIVEYTAGLSRDEVLSDAMRVYGILFNLQISITRTPRVMRSRESTLDITQSITHIVCKE
jgi:uncharacterized protein with HEPN domain